MIEEISHSSLSDYSRYFPGPQAGMVFDSILSGNTAGRLWVLSTNDREPLVLLWDRGNNVFYFSGGIGSDLDVEALASLITKGLRLESLRVGRDYFTVRPLSPGFDTVLAKLFQAIEFHALTKFFYRCKLEVPQVPAPIVSGVQFASIDRVLLKRADVQNLNPVVSEIRQMWPSLERFLERGFGYGAMVGGRVIGWCTAEYVSDSQCRIGIETVAAYENKGVATALASRFIALCNEMGISPHWECDSRNKASIRVAEKVGFEKIGESAFWAGRFR